jgi:hypothetical protein
MVHALEQAQRVLKSDGYLIDIQPLIEAPLIKVFQGNSVVFVEPDPSYDYEADLRQADAALTQIIQRGLFAIEERREFDFLTHGSSAPELLTFWSKGDAAEQRIQDVYTHFEKIRLAAGSGTEIALHERARIIRLKPNATNEETM